MNIAVCDDEKEMRNYICSRIRSFMPRADISEFSGGSALCGSQTEFDIIYLDIKMNGQDGMETAKKLRSAGCNAVIIFVTAVEDYVYRAFDVGAFHYLMKPVDNAKFFEVLNKAAAQCAGKIKNSARENERCIIVKKGKDHVKIALSDIIYAEIFNRKIVIHCKSGETEFYGKINELEKQAGEGFFRPHRAFLINLAYVVRYNCTEIILESGSVPVAKQKYSEFVKKYLEFLKAGNADE